MAKKLWLKGALFAFASGTTLALYGGCLDAIIQRILVAVSFD